MMAKFSPRQSGRSRSASAASLLAAVRAEPEQRIAVLGRVLQNFDRSHAQRDDRDFSAAEYRQRGLQRGRAQIADDRADLRRRQQRRRFALPPSASQLSSTVTSLIFSSPPSAACAAAAPSAICLPKNGKRPGQRRGNADGQWLSAPQRCQHGEEQWGKNWQSAHGFTICIEMPPRQMEFSAAGGIYFDSQMPYARAALPDWKPDKC